MSKIEAVLHEALVEVDVPVAYRHAIIDAYNRRTALSTKTEAQPVDMVLYCPKCNTQHIDAPEKSSADRPVLYGDAWTNPPHKSHLCRECHHVWRPSDTPTKGVERTTSGKDADTAPFPQQEILLVAAELGLDYAKECLAVHDQKYQRHPATEAERGLIESHVEQISAAIAASSKGSAS